MVTTHCPSPAKVVRHALTGTSATDTESWRRFSTNFIDPPDLGLLHDSDRNKATAVSHDSPRKEKGCRGSDNSGEDEAFKDGSGLDRHLRTSLSLADHLITPQNNKQGREQLSHN